MRLYLIDFDEADEYFGGKVIIKAKREPTQEQAEELITKKSRGAIFVNRIMQTSESYKRYKNITVLEIDK